MRINDKEYQCDLCKGIFTFISDESWNEEKAITEYKMYFPNSSIENREIICDDCWQRVRPDRN